MRARDDDEEDDVNNVVHVPSGWTAECARARHFSNFVLILYRIILCRFYNDFRGRDL